MGSQPIYTSSGGIRTYLHLLEFRNVVKMHLVLIVLAAVLEDG